MGSKWECVVPKVHYRPPITVKELQRERENDRSYELYYTAVQAFSSTKRTVQALGSLLSDHHATTAPEVQRLLEPHAQNLKAQEDRWTAFLEHIPPISRKPPAASELAAKVFAMPELLEQILLYLSTRDIQWTYGVSRTFHDTIENSIRLQRKLGLTPDYHCDWHWPIHSFNVRQRNICLDPPENVSASAYRGPGPNKIKIGLTILSGRVYNPGLSPRCSRMLVCQPPCKEFEIEAWCCHNSPGGRAISYVRSRSGITWGDLIEAVSKVHEEHSLCPNAPVSKHEEDGYVELKVDIEGVVHVQPGDPIFAVGEENRRAEERGAISQVCYNAQHARIQRYIAGKQSARDKGDPIPTLDEFEAREAAGQQ